MISATQQSKIQSADFLQYEKNKFGYFLPGEEELEEEGFFKKLFSISYLRTFQAGEVLLSGDTDDRLLFHVISGNVLVFAGKTLLEVGPGEIAGESRFLQPNPCGSMATMAARDAVQCLVTPFEPVQTLCGLDATFDARFHRGIAIAIASRLLNFQRQIQKYGETQAQPRVKISQPPRAGLRGRHSESIRSVHHASFSMR